MVSLHMSCEAAPTLPQLPGFADQRIGASAVARVTPDCTDGGAKSPEHLRQMVHGPWRQGLQEAMERKILLTQHLAPC
jgi:hypothetical protein